MNKSILVALLATLGLGANAGSLDSVKSLYTLDSKESVQKLNASINSIIGFSTDEVGLEANFDASDAKISTTVSKVGKWSKDTVSLVFEEPSKATSNDINMHSEESTKYVSGNEFGSYDASTAVAGSKLVQESGKMSKGVSGEYSTASKTGSTSVYTASKNAVKFTFNMSAKVVTLSRDGVTKSFTWSGGEFSNDPIKATGALFASAWTGLSDFSTEDLPDFLSDATVSVKNVSVNTFASKNVSGLETKSEKTGTFWLTLSVAGTTSGDQSEQSVNGLSNAETVSGASTILLKMPLNSATAVSTSTKKDDLDAENTPAKKKN